MSTPPSAAALRWDAETLWERLEPLLPGLSVEVVSRSPSTNSALLERARVSVDAHGELVQVRRSVESAAFGRRAADVQPCLLVAEHQTGGRGRLGRPWKAAPKASLTFSLSIPLAPPDWSGLSLAVGVAIAEALDPTPEGRPPRLGLKWPNDLWLMEAADAASAPPHGRKLGGILIETVSAGAQRLAVIGIGLNVLPQPSPLDVSTGYGCLQELDAHVSAPQALHRLAEPLIRALLQFNTSGFAPFVERFARRDLLRGHAITTTLPDLPEATALGIAADGALRARAPDGQERVVHSGEVSVRLHSGGNTSTETQA